MEEVRVNLENIPIIQGNLNLECKGFFSRKTWKEYYFAFSKEMFSYYKKKGDTEPIQSWPIGLIKNIHLFSEDHLETFFIEIEDITLVLKAFSEMDCHFWVSRVQQYLHTQNTKNSRKITDYDLSSLSSARSRSRTPKIDGIDEIEENSDNENDSVNIDKHNSKISKSPISLQKTTSYNDYESLASVNKEKPISNENKDAFTQNVTSNNLNETKISNDWDDEDDKLTEAPKSKNEASNITPSQNKSSNNLNDTIISNDWDNEDEVNDTIGNISKIIDASQISSTDPSHSNLTIEKEFYTNQILTYSPFHSCLKLVHITLSYILNDEFLKKQNMEILDCWDDETTEKDTQETCLNHSSNLKNPILESWDD